MINQLQMFVGVNSYQLNLANSRMLATANRHVDALVIADVVVVAAIRVAIINVFPSLLVCNYDSAPRLLQSYS